MVGDYPDLTNLILAARKINDSMPEHVLKRIRSVMREHDIRSVEKVGLYGLTYKENVDDTRESPTLQLLKKMDDHLAFGVKVFDPFVKRNLVDNQYHDFETFVDDVEIVVIMVAHEHLIKHKNLINKKIIIDTKNALNNEKAYKL